MQQCVLIVSVWQKLKIDFANGLKFIHNFACFSLTCTFPNEGASIINIYVIGWEWKWDFFKFVSRLYFNFTLSNKTAKAEFFCRVFGGFNWNSTWPVWPGQKIYNIVCVEYYVAFWKVSFPCSTGHFHSHPHSVI